MDPVLVPVLEFAAAISDHDVAAMNKLMTADFAWIDSDGSVYSSDYHKSEGWEEYFRMFPDYRIQVVESYMDDHRVVLIGKASGTWVHEGRTHPEHHWEVPVAWRATVRDRKVATWQIFVNIDPIVAKKPDPGTSVA